MKKKNTQEYSKRVNEYLECLELGHKLQLFVVDRVKYLLPKLILEKTQYFPTFQVINELKDISDKEEQMSRLLEILELTQQDFDERAKIAQYIQVPFLKNQAKMYFIF